MTASIAVLVPLVIALGPSPSPQGWARDPLAAQLGNEIVVSEETGHEYSPAIAYNSNRDEYLVVWQDAYDVVHGRRVLPSGQVLGRFVVAEGAYGKRQPSVAYDSIRDRYLVTWVYDYWGNGSDYDIFGRFIPWDGPSPSLHDFAVCDWTSNQARPAVVFAQAQNEYLVTWVNTPTGVASYISARRVWADGSGFPASGFAISSGPEDRDFPDVAYNLARNEYVVTWDANIGGGNVYGVRLSATGSVLGGGEFTLAGWPANEGRPSISACHRTDQYLVAWQSDQDTGGADWAIYGRYLDGDGVPGTVSMVDDTTAPEMEVDVSCDVGGWQYFLAWQTMYSSALYGVWGRVAYPDETMEPQFGIVQPGPSHHRWLPAVGGGRATFMTAWEHEEGFLGYRDIHGRPVFPDLLFRDGFQ